jgi:NAD(P)-dependent dehydrogenase (short-subunit alcohol dehydrogenase family)
MPHKNLGVPETRTHCKSAPRVFRRPPSASQFTQLVPIGRLGDAREVAEVALYLASDAASYVSGPEIAVCRALTA